MKTHENESSANENSANETHANESEMMETKLGQSNDPIVPFDMYLKPRTPKPAKPVQWAILACALLIGVAFDRLVFAMPNEGKFGLGYASFWLIYLAAFLFLMRGPRLKKITPLALCTAAALLCTSNFLWDAEPIRALNLLAIPLVLMLHSQMTSSQSANDPDSVILLRCFQGFFIWPFMRLSGLVSPFSGVMKADKGNTRKVLIGLAIGLPLLLIISSLLFSADAVVGYYGDKLLHHFDLGAVVSHLIVILVATSLFCSFLTNAVMDDTIVKPFTIEKKWEPATVSVVLAMLCAVYALFCAVQFVYLFGAAGLPASLTYSEYARKGFGELLAVAFINLSLFGACLRLTREHKVVRGLLLTLIALTGVLLFSALRRLGLYIDAYGLTWLRVFPFTFMLALGVGLVLCVVRLFVPRLPLLRLFALVCIVWYLFLAMFNVEAFMVRWNNDSGKPPMTLRDTLDGMSDDGQNEYTSSYVASLSSDAMPALLDYANAESDPVVHEWILGVISKKQQKLQEHGCWNLSNLRTRSLPTK